MNERPKKAIGLTSGLFPLLNHPAAPVPSLSVWIANPTPRSAIARVVVSESHGGMRAPKLNVKLDVPGNGTASTGIANLDDFQGRAAEISVTLSDPRLEPSAAMMNNWSDGTEYLLLYIPSGDFSPLS